MNDNSKMPFGKHEGIKLANVPSSYLIWFWENGKGWPKLKAYIQDNLKVLKKDAEEERLDKLCDATESDIY